MITSFKMSDYEEHSCQLIDYLRKLGYSIPSIKSYIKGLEGLKNELISSGNKVFNSDCIDNYVNELKGEDEYQDLRSSDKFKIRVISVLYEFIITETISFRTKRRKYNFDSPIGLIIQEYFIYRRSRNTSERTLESATIYLSRFHAYLIDVNINDISQITILVIEGYINTLTIYSAATIHCTLCALRVFFRFLHQSDYLEIDFSLFVPKDNYKKQAKLPTTYSNEEIIRVINSIDRANPKGKRDYAIILLASRLGLRASDICNLKFQNIHWEENIIKLFQKKTCNPIELPLLAEIGNAIIDYIKYARPVSKCDNIFLHQNPKYAPLKSPTIHSIVTQYLREAKIENISVKKHGPHALRHSLAGRLLENKTPLPVISEVLGHSNTESTKAYLSISIIALRDCALDVPPLNNNFYGGDKR